MEAMDGVVLVLEEGEYLLASIQWDGRRSPWSSDLQ
jgi:hypothetical protein